MLIDDFLVFLEVEKGYSPKTIREYAYDLQMFNGFKSIKDIPIENRSTTDLRRFF
jgi:site-specific recombinase XerD